MFIHLYTNIALLTNTHGACDVRDQRRRCTLDGNSSSLGMHQTRDIEIFEDLLVDRYMGWMNERVSGRGRVLWQIWYGNGNSRCYCAMVAVFVLWCAINFTASFSVMTEQTILTIYEINYRLRQKQKHEQPSWNFFTGRSTYPGKLSMLLTPAGLAGLQLPIIGW